MVAICEGLTLNSTFKCLYSPVPTTCTPVIDLLFVFPLTFWAHTPLFLPRSSCRLYTNKPQLDPIINEIKSWAQLLGLASRMVQFQVHPKWVVCCSLSQIRPIPRRIRVVVVQPNKDAGREFCDGRGSEREDCQAGKARQPKGRTTFTAACGQGENQSRRNRKNKKVNGVRKRRQANYLQITTPYRVTLKTQHAQTQALTNRLEKKNPLFSKRKRRSQILSLYTPRLLSPSLSEYFLLFYLHISDSSNRS